MDKESDKRRAEAESSQARKGEKSPRTPELSTRTPEMGSGSGEIGARSTKEPTSANHGEEQRNETPESFGFREGKDAESADVRPVTVLPSMPSESTLRVPAHPLALARRDESGKLLPPDPKAIEALLLSTSQRPKAQRMKNAAKWLWAFALLLLLVEAVAFAALFFF